MMTMLMTVLYISVNMNLFFLSVNNKVIVLRGYIGIVCSVNNVAFRYNIYTYVFMSFRLL